MNKTGLCRNLIHPLRITLVTRSRVLLITHIGEYVMLGLEFLCITSLVTIFVL